MSSPGEDFAPLKPLLPPRPLCGIYMETGTFHRKTPSGPGGPTMPTYSFECRKCGHKYQEILSFKEYETEARKCSRCGSKRVVQVLEPFYAKTSRKS